VCAAVIEAADRRELVGRPHSDGGSRGCHRNGNEMSRHDRQGTGVAECRHSSGDGGGTGGHGRRDA